MKLSTREQYGVRAMVELARFYGQGPLPLTMVSRLQKISLAYLEQIVAPLREAGLVVSTRGAHGGYHLAREPQAITVGDVLRALEGPIAPVQCASEVRQPGYCEREEVCLTRAVWEKVRDSIVTALDSTTLADLIEQAPE
jgi:Rrf2 family cysteine metabolism transcriptional repressor